MDDTTIGKPITYSSGPYAGRTIRAELHEYQKPDLGRKFAKRDRRPLDPPPVVRLRLWEVFDLGLTTQSEHELHADDIDIMGLVAHIDLFPAPDGNSNTNQSQDATSSLTTSVFGSSFVHAVHMLDMTGQPVVFFVWADVSVRLEGSFALRYRFFDLLSHTPNSTAIPVAAELYSGPFTVYSTKEFPGLQASTPLTKTSPLPLPLDLLPPQPFTSTSHDGEFALTSERVNEEGSPRQEEELEATMTMTTMKTTTMMEETKMNHLERDLHQGRGAAGEGERGAVEGKAGEVAALHQKALLIPEQPISCFPTLHQPNMNQPEAQGGTDSSNLNPQTQAPVPAVSLSLLQDEASLNPPGTANLSNSQPQRRLGTIMAKVINQLRRFRTKVRPAQTTDNQHQAGVDHTQQEQHQATPGTAQEADRRYLTGLVNRRRKKKETE